MSPLIVLPLSKQVVNLAPDYIRLDLDGIVVIRLQRQLPLKQILAVIEEVAGEGVPDRRLWDVGEYFDFSSDEVRRIAGLGRQLWPGPARVAYVGSGPVYYGMLRMFEAHRDQDGYLTQAFSDEVDALAWLREGVQ